MTLPEFLHPLDKAGRTDQVLAVLLFHRDHTGQAFMTAAEVQSALVQARISGAKGMNVHQALTRSGRYAHQAKRGGPWEITASGEKHLRALYEVPDLPSNNQAKTDASALRSLVHRASDIASREYVDEAIECLEAGARRAAVVFLWSGAIATIREAVWEHGVRAVEAALQRHNPKARFKKKNDFDYVKDADLLQVAQDLSIYDKSQKRHLGDALDLRNDCGHPVKYKPGQKKVEGFIEDVVGIVWP
jgi:hypothetical protein